MKTYLGYNEKIKEKHMIIIGKLHMHMEEARNIIC